MARWGVGIKYIAKDNLWIDLAYKYINLGEFSTSNVQAFTTVPSPTPLMGWGAYKGSIRSNEVLIGIIYKI